MRISSFFGRTLFAGLAGFGLAASFGASAVGAHSGVDRLDRETTSELFVTRSELNEADPMLSLSAESPSIEIGAATAAGFDPAGSIELASNDYYDDPQPRKRGGPARSEVRGHENDMQVTRRRATPIPRVTSSKPKRRFKQGRPGYNSSYYGPGGYGGHGHYYYGHVHHSHCGHGYYGYGDHFDSRTLGRSCMYGPKGEVIYKPADVICAPEDEAELAVEPAARPAAARVERQARPRTEPRVRTKAPRQPAPRTPRAPVQPTH